MKHFIFLTKEGFTQTPDNKDIENLQVLGVSSGNNKEEAFENFKKENEYLQQTNFNEVIVMELASEKQNYFSFKNHG